MRFSNVGTVQQTSLSEWKWTISNYSSFPTIRTILRSPNFSIAQSYQITNWRFELWLNDCNTDPENFRIVALKNLDETDVAVKFNWLIFDRANEVILKKYPYQKNAYFIEKRSLATIEFPSHGFINEKDNGALTDDTFVLQCCIHFDPQHDLVENLDTVRLKYDFEKLLNSQKHSDVTFVIGRKKMHLHKGILASRSPVFERMFEHDMKENQQNTVEITDVKSKIMMEMCRYIYAGKVNEIYNIAKDLLIAADKYCIDELKFLCEKAICDQLNNDNALEYLAFATTFKAEYLKPRVYKFVTSSMKDFYDKPEFKKLDPDIKDEIMGILIGVKSVD